MSINASASVIYDSSSMYAVGTTSPTATSGFNGNVVLHPTIAYYAQQNGEYGGKIGLAGSDRLAESATIQIRTGTPIGNVAVSGSVTLTLSFYGIAPGGSIGALLGYKTQQFAAPAAADNTSTPYVNEGRPYYDATFNLTSLNLTLPDQLYFGVALNLPGSSTTTQSTNLSLWDYGTAPGWLPTDSTYDGTMVKVGTDLSQTTWFRTLSGTTDFSTVSGFTPNLTLTAVPEPDSFALVGIGAALVLGVSSLTRRRFARVTADIAAKPFG